MPKKKKKEVEQVQEEQIQEEHVEESEEELTDEELLEQLTGGDGKSIIVLPPMMGGGSSQEKKPRVVPVIGDISERMALEVISGLVTLKDTGLKKVLSDPSDMNSEIITKQMPIEMIISTFGGSALDMFGICDLMRVIQEDGCPIITTGIGKVMSAGVLILASGTKGARQIGRNTRVMIHSVIAGAHGPIHNIENEVDEIKWVQERYIDVLVRETDMTKRMVKKLLDKKVNIYLDAQQAVDYGIADIII